MSKILYFFLILLMVSACGCASGTIYVDTDEVPGLGVEVQFPAGKVVPIRVKRVISGNIIELTNKEEVSYIGVYIPQLYDIPKEAKSLNEKLIKEGDIRLEFDKKKRDSKGRLLAYVYTIDGKFINKEIIKEGLAQALITPKDLIHKDLLVEAEEEARKSCRGIWSKDFKK